MRLRTGSYIGEAPARCKKKSRGSMRFRWSSRPCRRRRGVLRPCARFRLFEDRLADAALMGSSRAPRRPAPGGETGSARVGGVASGRRRLGSDPAKGERRDAAGPAEVCDADRSVIAGSLASLIDRAPPGGRSVRRPVRAVGRRRLRPAHERRRRALRCQATYDVGGGGDTLDQSLRRERERASIFRSSWRKTAARSWETGPSSPAGSRRHFRPWRERASSRRSCAARRLRQRDAARRATRANPSTSAPRAAISAVSIVLRRER